MDALLPKKTALKSRASLLLLFGSQKPTFAALDEKPTRYYDFVDVPGPSKYQSHLISRQEISRELESEIRYACSLLVHRIELGVPSPPNNPVGLRAAPNGPVENISAKPQHVLTYSSSKVGPEAAVISGYDSGVGLTQQPSIQTMRVLNSRSGETSDSGDTRTVSVFSNTRIDTSCSNTSAINSTEPSYSQTSAHSPRQNELQSITGKNLTRYTQYQNHATKAFLTEVLPLEPPPYKENASEDIEVFLNPTATTVTNLSSETLSSHPSPSLGLSRFPAHTQQRPTSNPDCDKTLRKSRSIIIDSTGHARLLTSDEESQRHKELQQAVLEKMTPKFMKYDQIHEPSPRHCRPNTAVNNRSNAYRSPDSQNRPPTSASRFGLSWFGKLGSFFSHEQSSSSFSGNK
ncbi:hypothetical protein BJX76DRAFT_317101 [Aspergillus varians]